MAHLLSHQQPPQHRHECLEATGRQGRSPPSLLPSSDELHQMVTEKNSFDGALRARAFPIIVNHFLPRAREVWVQNNWASCTPSSSLDAEGRYLPPFLQSLQSTSTKKNLTVSITSSLSSTPAPPPVPVPKSLSPSSKRRPLHYGILWKLGQGFLLDPWAQRFFVLDHRKHTLAYYAFHSSLVSLASSASSSTSSISVSCPVE
jgi:hypothetical protein